MGMKVFLPVATNQDLVIRARKNASFVDLSVREELKDVTVTISSAASFFCDGYLTIPFTHSFTEGVTYEITVTDSFDSELIWRGKAFCTAQTPNFYKLNT